MQDTSWRKGRSKKRELPRVLVFVLIRRCSSGHIYLSNFNRWYSEGSRKYIRTLEKQAVIFGLPIRLCALNDDCPYLRHLHGS